MYLPKDLESLKTKNKAMKTKLLKSKASTTFKRNHELMHTNQHIF